MAEFQPPCQIPPNPQHNDDVQCNRKAHASFCCAFSLGLLFQCFRHWNGQERVQSCATDDQARQTHCEKHPRRLPTAWRLQSHGHPFCNTGSFFLMYFIRIYQAHASDIVFFMPFIREKKYLTTMGAIPAQMCINNVACHCTFMTRVLPPSAVRVPVDMFS